MQVYSRYPCEKPLNERVFGKAAKEIFKLGTGANLAECSS